MSEHRHHDKGCRCKECEDNKNSGEKTSIEEAGGVAVGLKGHIHGYNADAAARLSDAILATGKWVEKESGSMLGHIKAAIYDAEGKGITLNLTDIDSGVEQHGSLSPQENADFTFMAAVLDVDSHSLEHFMMDALDDSGIDYHLDDQHHHHHDHEHSEHGHHGHHHEHDEDGVCHCRSCEDHREEEKAKKAEKGSFWNKIRRKQQ